MKFETPAKAKLLVEGLSDLHAVIHILKKRYDWPEDKYQVPVELINGRGKTKILKRSLLSTALQSREIDRFGIILDADSACSATWQSVKGVLDSVVNLPGGLPSEGYVGTLDAQKRLGIWIMPDNQSSGCLETLMQYLVPEQRSHLLKLADRKAQHAKRLGAPWREVHRDKAVVHTFLAWQDPPALSLGMSVFHHVLRADAPPLVPFLQWFDRLYSGVDGLHPRRE